MNIEGIEDLYPLSPMQRGVLFDSLYSPGTGAYVEQRFCTLRGTMRIDAFERAWQRIVDRHSVLRTAFVWEGLDEPAQVAHKRLDLSVARLDWRDLSSPEQQERFAAHLEADRRLGFELSDAPLMRLTLIRFEGDVHRFVWTYHHLLLDGWSWPLLVKEAFTFYGAFSRGERIEMDQPRPYRDYIAWLKQQDPLKAEDFWRATLKGFKAPIVLGVDKGARSRASGAGREFNCRLPQPLTSALAAFARERELTLNTIIQSVYALLLSRYSGCDDVVFGAVVSGRPAELAGVEAMVGLFINTLPVRVIAPARTPALEWLKDQQSGQAKARQYEYSSLVEIHGWSEIARGAPLFETILVFENYPIDLSTGFVLEADSASDKNDGLEVADLRFAEDVNYPFSLVVTPGRELALRILYDSHRFSSESIRRLIGHFQMLLESILADPWQSVGAAPMLTPAERHQILFGFNDHTASFPIDRCIHELFETQAAKTPDAVAVESQDETLSYSELDARANRIAHYLESIGAGPETQVGLLVERSAPLIAALLGVLKSGAAYVPLSPQAPVERLAFILENAGIQIVLTEQHLLDRLPSLWLQTYCLDSDRELFAAQSPAALARRAAPGHIAYVVYTSGSTGQPKGVMVSHAALVNNISAMNGLYGLSGRDRLLQFVAFSFDVFAQEVFTTLTSGAALILHPNPAELAPLALARLLERQAISVVHIPPAYWHQLVDELWKSGQGAPGALRLLVVGAESPAVDKLAAWARMSRPDSRFINAYGPAEAAITNSAFATMLQAEEIEAMDKVPIGLPAANNRIYILDEKLEPVPDEFVGEIFIGGAGLARGYQSRPDLTAEKFIPHPFSDSAGARVYRTGDLSRRRPDGQLEFAGRRDNQVKLRGFRIELDEIDIVLNQHPAVRESVVVIREDRPGDRRLVGYVALSQGIHDEREALASITEYLQRKLPAYMTPSPIIALAEMPLTDNGKINRRALPAPGPLHSPDGEAEAAPRTTVEQIVADIWKQVLGVERLGVFDDFFELGGHSLLATQIISRVRDQFQVEVPLSALFESPTVAGLAMAITRQQVGLEDSHEADRLLAEMENLSDAEVERLLLLEPNLSESSKVN